MSSFRIYDHDRDEELLPERDNREIKGFGYSTPEDALEAYTRVYEDLDAFYTREQVSIQELERIGWIDMQKLPSRREMIERAETEAFQQLEEEIDKN